MSEQKFPDLPDPTELPRRRLLSPVAYWWIGTVLLLGITIVWLPSQCSTETITTSEKKLEDMNSLPQADQSKDLEFREDGLWYEAGSTEPFSGAAVSYREDGGMKSRTKIRNGEAYGLIEEWDENGSVRGNLFKEEFNK